ncbi:MAG: NlpC/P60 family protein [Smithellaceae bacterium]|nr:NlpC/P60 family protein [Smithellaceae bacterium]
MSEDKSEKNLINEGSELKDQVDSVRSTVDSARDLFRGKNGNGKSGSAAQGEMKTGDASNVAGASQKPATAGASANTAAGKTGATSGTTAGAGTASAMGGATAETAAGAAAGSTAGAAAGSAAGATSGAAAGAAAGTAVAPGVGTAIGVAVGTFGKTLVKILISVIALVLALVIIVYVVLPSVVVITVADQIAEIKHNIGRAVEGKDIYKNTAEELQGLVIDLLERRENSIKYGNGLSSISQNIHANDYDYDRSMASITDTIQGDGLLDAAFILSAYSLSYDKDTICTEHLMDMLEKKKIQYYDYYVEEHTITEYVPFSAPIYASMTVPTYEGNVKIYYPTGRMQTIDKPTLMPIYSAVSIYNRYSSQTVEGYTITSYENVTPEEREIKYGSYTVYNQYSRAIEKAFKIKLDSWYKAPTDFSDGETYRERATTMSIALLKTLGQDVSSRAGNIGRYGEQAPLTQAEIDAILASLECSSNRKYIIYTAASLVGKVPYFWGGRTEWMNGFDPEWGNERAVAESYCKQKGWPVGTKRPYGLDCTGFVSWVYKRVFTPDDEGYGPLKGDYSGNLHKYPTISASELMPGDVGFYHDKLSDGTYQGHAAIYLYTDENGDKIWIHEAGWDKGCIISKSTNIDTYISMADLLSIEPKAPPADSFMEEIDNRAFYKQGQYNSIIWTYDGGYQ